MGYLKEKYTEEYYTGKSKSGKKLNYGATISLDDKGQYVLREHDAKILRKINFKEKTVLALGCGRGEELVYAINNGSDIDNTVGVDFSDAAIKICKRLFGRSKVTKQPKLFAEDALEFIPRYQKLIRANKAKKFDVVIMFDFVEHVPRDELLQIITGLKCIINKRGLIVVNTPAYKYDNDVIKDGYDNRNNIGTYDTSDDNPKTKGMHCNKYSIVSLQDFMSKGGYINITEAHYFVTLELVTKRFCCMSYCDRWRYARRMEVSIVGRYSDDILEYPYGDLNDLGLYKFKSGNLAGISIITTESYRKVAYPNSNTDPEMISSIKSMNPVGKVIFDVGVFVGACSMLFSKIVGKNGKVLGFEPIPFNRNRAFLNLSHNKELTPNITVYKYALGGENGSQNMVLSSQIDTGYSSTSRLEGSHSTIRDVDLPEGFEEKQIEVKTLDAFVDTEKVLPDIIKVDIEGAEYDFLLGAIDTIRKVHPIFYIELHSQYCATKCTELLVLEGYSIVVLREEEDNRVMVLAEYTNESSRGANVKKMKFLDTNFSTLKNISESLMTLNKNVHTKDSQILELIEVNKTLVTEKERADAAESINKLLSERIISIESSRSWVITKPFRKIVRIIRISEK